MQTHRCFFLSVLLVFCIGNANAQSSDKARNPVKGDVITNDNDTIYGTIDYLTGEWWMPARAVIKKGNEYERYDFSDETKYDEEMWELVEGDYDEFENSDSFELIGRDVFQTIWNDTVSIHEPMSW